MLQTTASSITHTGNAVATNFSVPFKFFEDGDLTVTRILISSGAGVILSSSDYTVNGAGDENGGSVDYLMSGSPLSALYQLKIERNVSFTQDLEINNQSGFLPSSLERQLDLLAMQIQQLRQDVADLVSDGTIVSLTDAVAGPASAVNNRIALFDGTTGKLLKDSGSLISDLAAASHAHSFASLTSKPSTIGGYGITDLQELVEDYVDGMFTAGSHTGISFSYNDTTGAFSATVPVTDWTELFRDTDSTIATNTTLASDSVLQFTMLASGVYAIEADLFLNVPSACGQKTGITGPSSPTSIKYWERESDDNNTTTQTYVAAYGTVRANTPGANRNVHKLVRAVIVNGSNAGTFALQFAQNVSNASALSIYKGSKLRYKKIA
jgi:hypothetical protein